MYIINKKGNNMNMNVKTKSEADLVVDKLRVVLRGVVLRGVVLRGVVLRDKNSGGSDQADRVVYRVVYNEALGHTVTIKALTLRSN
jgi:hypothetical protein